MMPTLQRSGLPAGLRRLMMAGLAASAFSPISVERASAQATLPSLPDVTKETMTPNANWSQLIITPLAPLTQPSNTAGGDWTFGEGGNTPASATVPALNPQLAVFDRRLHDLR